MTSQLTEMTGTELTERENVIEHGKQAFIQVGLALMEIRERHGYQMAGYQTFEQYCRERWGWSNSWRQFKPLKELDYQLING